MNNIPLYMNLHLICPHIRRWAFGLFPSLGFSKQLCYEHCGIVISHGVPIFNLLKIHELFQSSCTILHPHQCCVQILSFCFKDVKNRSDKMVQQVRVLAIWGFSSRTQELV